jgi:hypothetical protein
MPAHLVPSGEPWVDPTDITTSTTFALSVPLRNDGDTPAEQHDVVVLDLAVDDADERKTYHVTAVGAEPGQEYSGTVHVNGYELSAGHWHVSSKAADDSGYSDFHLEFDIAEG